MNRSATRARIRYLLTILAIAIVTGSVINYFKTKTIMEGSFEAFEIGASKEAIFRELLRDNSFESVQPQIPYQSSVTEENIDSLPEFLSRAEAVAVRGPSVTINLFFDGQRVEHIQATTEYARELSNKLRSRKDALAMLKEAIRKGEVTRAFSIIRGWDYSNLRFSVDTTPRAFDSEDSGYRWLVGYDVWTLLRLVPLDSTKLYFDGDHLTKIENRRLLWE